MISIGVSPHQYFIRTAQLVKLLMNKFELIITERRIEATKL